MSDSTAIAIAKTPSKMASILEMMKARLSFLVVFSAAMTFLLASHGDVNYLKLIFLVVGGFLVTGAANTINQIAEVKLDALMKRTMNRPLPTGRITIDEAKIVALDFAIVGSVVLVVFVNIYTALLTLFSAILYGFVYTPLKQKSPIAVLVGAIPGAMPPLIGWVASTNMISAEAMVLFGIQFIWQFPHFWAIAWVLDEDYKRAGFRLLPSGGGRDLNTAFQIMIYTLFLLPLGMLPTQMGITGMTSAIVATVCGSLFLMQTFNLMRQCTDKAARQIMFGSFFYLPIVQITFVLDKVIQ
jgi:protoheme IX farnesyltransferase